MFDSLTHCQVKGGGACLPDTADRELGCILFGDTRVCGSNTKCAEGPACSQTGQSQFMRVTISEPNRNQFNPTCIIA